MLVAAIVGLRAPRSAALQIAAPLVSSPLGVLVQPANARYRQGE
jgi:hypothetical protein